MSDVSEIINKHAKEWENHEELEKILVTIFSDLQAQLTAAQQRIEQLTGRRFSDRMYPAMESKLAAANEKVRELEQDLEDAYFEGGKILSEGVHLHAAQAATIEKLRGALKMLTKINCKEGCKPEIDVHGPICETATEALQSEAQE